MSSRTSHDLPAAPRNASARPGDAVLVSGASSGIGLACALHLAQHGLRVYAGHRALEEPPTALRGKGIVPVRLDVTNAEQIEAVVDVILAAPGSAGLAGLVNNAGVAVAGPLEYLSLEAFREQIEVNVVGALALTQACLPMLRERRGRIVNMGSIAGKLATPMMGAYAASKFAMEGITDTLRRELMTAGVRVSLIAPGPTATPIWGKAARHAETLVDRMPHEAHAAYGDLLRRSMSRAARRERSGTPTEEVAAAVLHALTSARPRTRYVVGRQAKIGTAMASILPDRWLDAYLLRRR